MIDRRIQIRMNKMSMNRTHDFHKVPHIPGNTIVAKRIPKKEQDADVYYY